MNETSILNIEDLASELNVSRQNLYQKRLKYKDYAQLLEFSKEYLKLRYNLGYTVKNKELLIHKKNYTEAAKAKCDFYETIKKFKVCNQGSFLDFSDPICINN